MNALIGLFFLFATVTLYAVDATTATIPPDQVFHLILQAIGGRMGAGTMALVLVVVQVAYALMRSKLGEKTGIWRLSILSGLALVLGFVGLLANGVPFTSALFHASLLPLIQTFIAQVVIQLGNHPEDKAAVAVAAATSETSPK